MYAVNRQGYMPRSTYLIEYGLHVARLRRRRCRRRRCRRRRRAHAPAIYAASHVDHEKRDASFSYNYGAPLGAIGAAGAPLKNLNLPVKQTTRVQDGTYHA